MRKMLLLATCTLLLCVHVLAQTRTVSGKVNDPDGVPVANASVLVKGSSLGTTTDLDGTFSLTVPTTAKALVISAINMETMEVSIENRNVVSVTLRFSDRDLQEVVVTGYNTQKKSEYVGAATKIDKKEIELVPIGSFDQILQGRAPGLRVSAGSGQPGAAASVQIRGPKSIGGGSTPLYVIDGVPVEPAVFQSYNPNDFESVDVIKDAAAAGLYGSRGASGVIVVTTKRGKAGKLSLSYRPQFGISQPGTQKFEMMNTAELLQFQEMYGQFVNNNLPGWRYSPNNPANASLTPEQKAEQAAILDSIRKINTDWADVFQRNGSFSSHDLNLSGGSDKTRFYASVGYYKEDGIGLRTDLERYTLRFNMDHKSDRLTFQLSNVVGYSKRNFTESEGAVALANPFAAAYLGAPYHKLYNDDGTVAVGSGRVGPNAFARLENSIRDNHQVKATSSVNMRYDITSNFYVGGNAGFDFRETINSFWLDPKSYAAQTSGFPANTGTYSDGFTRFFQGNARGYIGYHNTFGVHRIDASVNAEYVFAKNRSFNFTGYNLSDKLKNTPAAVNPGTVDNGLIPAVGGGKSQSNLVSFFGLAKYSYDDRYIFDVTIRHDGTSILPVANRWQSFFAVGGIWNVLAEKFAANWGTLSTLRFRASYGNSANRENFPFGDFGYYSLYGNGSYAGFQTIIPTDPGNPQGEWEYTDKLNVGFEVGLWRDRVSAEVNLYNEITRNLFVVQTNPVENGFPFTRLDVNAGKMRNRGIELNVKADIIWTADLTWSVDGNFAYNQNEILDLGQVSEYPSGTAIIRKGLPLGSHYAVKWAGVDPATGKPLYYTKDGKLTDVFSDANSVADFGTYFAPYTGGFGTTLRYKGIELSAFFNFQYKFSRFNNQDFFQLNHAFAAQGYNVRKEMLQMWTKPGDITNIQSPLYQREFSSKDIQDASYLRFRNLMLSYTLPTSVTNRLKVVKKLRFYGQAQNLYTWTNWTGFDPEDSNNIAQYEYPLPRIFTVGVDVDF